MSNSLKRKYFGTTAAFVGALLAATAAGAQEPIKIGVVTPLSGSYAPIGKQVRWGAELAVKEINAAGGVKGRKFELLFEDEEANPPVAVRRAEKLLQQDKVHLLTGTVNSGSTLAVGQVAQRNDRLLITTVSYSPAITGTQCNPNVFRVNANAFMQSNALVNWLVKNVSGKRYFFIGPDYEMGRSTIAAFRADVKRLGGNDVGAVFPPLGAKDFSPYFGQLRAARPDVIMTATAGNDTVRLITQMRDYGLLSDELTMAGASGAVTQENIGAMNGAADGFAAAAGYSVDLDTPANKKFVAAFRAAYHADPDLFAADTYGLFYLLKQAIEKAGGTETAKLREAMRGMKWETPQGTKQIRAGDHQAIMDMYIVRIDGDTFRTAGKVEGEIAIGPDKCEQF
ncbi:MAG TPA: ABC transporter substrate-binding protein [Burkholderiales bacterium]